MKTSILFIVLISSFVIDVFGCGFGSLGGGGGGGCGCSNPCGRKKREVQLLEPHLRTEDQILCPQTEWKKIMEDSTTGEAETSKLAIQSTLYKKYDSKFFVFCGAIDKKPQFAANGEGFCVHSKDNMTCMAIALIG
uniref:Ground-like domain-containing protein n=1 Tax=Panagrolaimus sp. JU765 TaxID=591449 RepID=A0AC34Q3H4_9BILA